VAFYSFYFFTSACAHSNFERSARGIPFFGTATGHAIHHARILGNYGFFTTIHDRLFGTLWRDTGAAHGRVVAGAPLRALNERIGETK
jgi:sterol desaturase/sphingolipid hydroxylase (fatty acid hydroxylase superfamily)